MGQKFSLKAGFLEVSWKMLTGLSNLGDGMIFFNAFASPCLFSGCDTDYACTGRLVRVHPLNKYCCAMYKLWKSVLNIRVKYNF